MSPHVILIGSCLDLGDVGEVDALFADWPYGSTRAAYDSRRFPLRAALARTLPLLRRGAPALFTADAGFVLPLFLALATPADERAIVSFVRAGGPYPRVRRVRHVEIWEKPNGTPGGAVARDPETGEYRRRAPLRVHEQIVVATARGEGLAAYRPRYGRGEPYNVDGAWSARDVGENYAGSAAHGGRARPHSSSADGRRWPRDVVRLDSDARHGRHKVTPGPPVQKPQALLRYLLGTYCAPGGLVLDPVAGSCSTALAAAETGRRSVSVEVREDWAMAGAARLQEAGHPVEVRRLASPGARS